MSTPPSERGIGKLHQQIDIALGAGLAAQYRPEQ
jgi:hypothetical protein